MLTRLTLWLARRAMNKQIALDHEAAIHEDHLRWTEDVYRQVHTTGVADRFVEEMRQEHEKYIRSLRYKTRRG